MQMLFRFLRGVAVAAIALFVFGCEPDVHMASFEDEAGGSVNVTGNWVGRGGTGQGGVTMTLNQSGSNVSGNYAYAGGGRRTVGGTLSGTTLSMTTQEGSRWTMTVSGNTLSGSAIKPDGVRYSLWFQR